MEKPIEHIIQGLVWTIVAYMVFLALINSTFGIDDFRMMYTFSTDEPYIVSQVQANLTMNELLPWGHYNYGYNYNSLGFIVLKFSSYFGYHVRQVRFIAYTLRLISLAGYILTLLLFYFTLRKLKIPGTLSSVFTLFLASLPTLYYWGQQIHPDMLALCFVVSAFLLMVLRQDAFGLLTSVLLAGLAFGTKYTGIFPLPFLCIPYMGTIIRSHDSKTGKIRKCFLTAVAVLFVFLLIWIATNPSAILFYQEFLEDISFESAHIARGHQKVESTNPFLWFPVLYQELSFAGTSIIVIGYLLGISALITFFKTTKYPKTNRHLVIFTLGLYTVVNLLYIMLSVNTRAPRYLFHILPYILLLASIGFTWLYTHIPSKIQVLCSCLVFVVIMSLSISSITAQNELSKKPYSEAIMAGNWLEETYPPSQKILYEIYSYIPDSFNHIKLSWYITQKTFQEFNPDILVLTQQASGRISWKQKGTRFLERSFVQDETHDYATEVIRFHDRLFSPTNMRWRIVYETENIVILEKQ